MLADSFRFQKPTNAKPETVSGYSTAPADMKMKVLALFALLLASGCGTKLSTLDRPEWIQPIQAIELAAAAAPDGVPGVFQFQVQGTGTKDNFSYLNSEIDYRDQRCLTIEITPRAARELEIKFGAPPIVAFKGKKILVRGVATRVKIVFISDGKPTDKYYYQTHVKVNDPEQIQLQQ